MGPVPAREEIPVRERHEFPGWVVSVRSEVGLVRHRLEDAWRILPNVRVAGQAMNALAVFDGLGGVPNGQEAAWAASDHLRDALEHAPRAADVLAHLNNWVRDTQGATTAVVALFPSVGNFGDGVVLSIGDSAAYALGPDRKARLLVPKDSDGPHVLTDYLGHAEAGGHVGTLQVQKGGALLLCTDGVDGVVEPDSIARLLLSGDLAAALDDLFAEILDRGAPDNATVVVARRLS